MRASRFLFVLCLVGAQVARAQQLTWTQPCSSGPQSGYYAQMVYDSAHRQMVFFGGVADPNNPTILTDTWTWDGTSWTKQSPATSPPGRVGFGMAYDSSRGRVVIFGGASQNGFLTDTWEWDGTNWTQKVNGPGPRLHVGMAYDAARQQVVLYGGSVGTPSPLADTWVYDGNSWTRASPATTPGPRANFRMAYDAARQQTVMFGGWNGSTEVNETWVWDGTNWTQKFSSPIGIPSPRQDFGITYDSNRQRTVLFSGILPPSIPADNNTYEWDGTNWAQDTPTQNPAGNGRGGVSMAYDAARGNVVMFGGVDSTHVFTDTWVFGAPVPTTCPFLGFPLKGTSAGVDEKLNPYTAPINSVFDHFMRNGQGIYHIYTCDSAVGAYTAETGMLDASGTDKDLTRQNRFKIGCKQGYEQDTFDSAFYVNGFYTGGGDATHLYYDGHPGIDYKASFGTQVYASTSGTLRYPTLADLKTQNSYIGGDPDKFNVLELDADNGYKIYYLHLSTHPRTISVHLTGSITGQDFIATRIGSPGTTAPGRLGSQSPFSISGRMSLNGNPLSGVTVTLEGIAETGSCTSARDATTDVNGAYRFSSLSAGFYHVRASLAGYAFQAASPNLIVPDGAVVNAGALIALSGNAGGCLGPHLHFEVQRKVPDALSVTQPGVGSLAFVPVDPYGWDSDPGTDPYEQVPGVKNARLWLHQPVVDAITPKSTSPGSIPLTISGQGFDSGVVDCIIMKSNNYFNPLCIEGTVQSRTPGQLVVIETLSAGTYFVHVQNTDGRRSNWKKLVIQ